MMPNRPSAHETTNTVDRKRILELIQSGIDTGSFQFIRQAAMAWLAAYPGDLEVNLLFVKAMVKEGKGAAALPVLEKIIRNDPEYLDALQVAESIYNDLDAAKARITSGMIEVIGGTHATSLELPVWGTMLKLASQSLAAADYDAAQANLFTVLAQVDCPVQAGIIHLMLEEKNGDKDSKLNLSRLYHARWPDCIQVSLFLAHSLMDDGSQDEAVALLHECAALDSTAQVPTRMWGNSFSYRALYPEKMQITANFAVPAAISGKFGMNNLGAGIPAPVENQEPVLAVQRTSVQSFDGYRVTPTAESEYPEHPHAVVSAAKTPDKASAEIQKEFEKIAVNLKTPSVVRSDNRFPTYVILTTNAGLTAQYGQSNTQIILDEVNSLAASLKNRKGWNNLVFIPDDLNICGKYGITPVDAIDPWKIKLALADLDAALGKTGAMIGAVLIVGGDKVVPFHNLPNPTDDTDTIVPSDNPYGSLDKNYYVADWPVGRLPGDSSDDSGLLLSQLRNASQYHSDETESTSWLNQLIRVLLFWNQSYAKNFTNLGYTASIWQRSSLSAFRPLGEGRNLFTSPNGKSAAFSPAKIGSAPYAYFNLHGVEDGSDWYGQKDSSDTSDSEDYPVALTPAQLLRNNSCPRIVFSEACYGGHILNKGETDSIALTFLGQGVLAMIGSSTVAYGSVTTPLIGADLLGNLVMKYLAEGQTIGYAFSKAKVDFVREMNLRQGYLDGEDQKTLISFILYGDPLVAYDPYSAMSKSVAREKDHPQVKTVVDQAYDEAKSTSVSATAIARAKEMAKAYLPGIEFAEVHVSRQHIRLDNRQYPTNSAAGKGSSARQSSRTVVSFSKQITFDQHVHRQYARVTLDQQGKVVKMAISR
jgi:hypothetical protein